MSRLVYSQDDKASVLGKTDPDSNADGISGKGEALIASCKVLNSPINHQRWESLIMNSLLGQGTFWYPVSWRSASLVAWLVYISSTWEIKLTLSIQSGSSIDLLVVSLLEVNATTTTTATPDGNKMREEKAFNSLFMFIPGWVLVFPIRDRIPTVETHNLGFVILEVAI